MKVNKEVTPPEIETTEWAGGTSTPISTLAKMGGIINGLFRLIITRGYGRDPNAVVSDKVWEVKDGNLQTPKQK